MRSTWTDERLDDFREHVDRRFDEVDRRLDHVVSETHRHTERIDALHRSIVTFATAVIAVLGTTCAALLGLLFTQV